MYNQAYNAYHTATVSTASQGQLIVLLYEGAIKELKTAVSLFNAEGKLDAGSIEKFGNCIQKASAIIAELQASLDMERGGEVASNLMSLYTFFNSELTSANITLNREKADFVMRMMGELVVSWRQIASSTANVPVSSGMSSLNIQG